MISKAVLKIILRYLITSFFLILFMHSKTLALVKIDTIKNSDGINAYFIKDSTNPIITIKFSFKGGASLDPSGQEGLANLAMKVISEGAGNLNSKEFKRKLEDHSIQLSFNTSQDFISGSLKTLVKSKDIAFNLLYLALTQARFEKESFERIRSQVLISLKQNKKNPSKLARKALFNYVFPNHPYKNEIIGNAKSIKNISANDLKKFVKLHLCKDKLFIGVVGDIDSANLKEDLTSIFSTLPNKSPLNVTPKILPYLAAKTISIQKPTAQSIILFALPGIRRDDPNFYSAFILNHILGGSSFTSRLYIEVREKRGLAYSVGSYLLPFDKSALTFLSVATNGPSTNKTIKVVKNEIKKMAKLGVTEEELSNAKKYLIGSFSLRFSSSERIASMLTNIQIHNLGIDYFTNRNNIIRQVSRESVNNLASKLLKESKLVTVIVGSQGNKIENN